MIVNHDLLVLGCLGGGAGGLNEVVRISGGRTAIKSVNM